MVDVVKSPAMLQELMRGQEVGKFCQWLSYVYLYTDLFILFAFFTCV